jgi:hypothetical protein
MNELSLFQMFMSHTGRQIDKWAHYFPIYERHFAQYRNKYVRVLEIGVDHGGSLQLWKRYFGQQAAIVGVDINPECAKYTEDRIEVHTMDQCDWRICDLGEFDIIIDDGSHVLGHQELSFKFLWQNCRGVYLIEDCHGPYPQLEGNAREGIVYRYPWVIVAEKSRRMIRGTPSRELNPHEAQARALSEARELYGPR